MRSPVTASAGSHPSLCRLANVRGGRRLLSAPAVIAVLLASVTASLFATPIAVNNASFETPNIVFAQSYDFNPPATSPIPWGFTQSGSQQIGAFDNTASDSEDYVDNADGAQMAFMFVGPLLTLFQDLTTTGSTFEIGKAYVFTIAAGGSQSLPDDAQLQLRLYYRDGSNNKVTVATSSFLFDPALDPGNINHLYDYSVTSPLVQAGNAWVGKSIGIEIATPGTPAFAYWDLDRARVESIPEASSLLLVALGVAGCGGGRWRRLRRA